MKGSRVDERILPNGDDTRNPMRWREIGLLVDALARPAGVAVARDVVAAPGRVAAFGERPVRR